MNNWKVYGFAGLLFSLTAFAGTVSFMTSLGPGAHATATVLSPWDVTLNVDATATAPDFTAVYAQAEYTAHLVVTFTGGTGGGMYSPLFTGGITYPGALVASWGGSNGSIPFVFGENQIIDLYMGVSTGVLPAARGLVTHNSGSVAFSGKFSVAGYPDAVATLSEVPEPSTAVTVASGLTLVFTALALVKFRAHRWIGFTSTKIAGTNVHRRRVMRG